MSDTTVKKIDSSHSPRGEMGQKYLASGKKLSMRLWEEEPGDDKPATRRDYETVGYLVRGKAELTLEGEKITLQKGDSWVVPEQSLHAYRVLETLVAVEATSPPSQVHERDRASGD